VFNLTSERAKFEIFSDLPFATSERTFSLDGNERHKQNIKIRPVFSGDFQRFIKFVNKNDDSYFWYSVNLQVSPASPEKTIRVETLVKQPKTIEIKIKNPLSNVAIQYEIELKGKFISGESHFTLFPQVPGVYDFLFAPGMT
jgi:hypothetical protein